MLIGEIIQRVQSLYSKGVQSDDSRLSERHIYNKMLTVRSKLISLKIKKKQIISDWNYTILPCVELIITDKHSCPCLPKTGQKVYRTKTELPKPLTNLDKHLIEWIYSLDNEVKYEMRSRESQSNISGNKYTANTASCVIEGNHIYFYGEAKDLYPVVKMKLLVEDPIEASNYPTYCPEEDCDDTGGEGETTTDCVAFKEKEFTIDNDLIDVLIEICSEELVIRFSQSIEDISNNSRDSLIERSK